MITGIYKILNKINGKFYIGSAINIKQRWRRHKLDLNKNIHQNHYLQRAWNKYWSVSFEFVILEICDKEQLLAKEQFWINETQCFKYEIGYNLTPTAGSSLGVKHSEETRKRMSLAKQKMSAETKELIRIKNFGKKLSEEHKAKIVKGLSGRPCSAETKAKIAAANTGKIRSVEARKKISEGNRNLGTKRGKYKPRAAKVSAPPIGY